MRLINRNGQGVMRWGDGTTYEGEWRNDVRHFGKMKLQNGLVYEGFWLNEYFHGRGSLTLKSGSVLQCVFTEGRTANWGTLRDKDHSLYVGSLS